MIVFNHTLVRLGASADGRQKETVMLVNAPLFSTKDADFILGAALRNLETNEGFTGQRHSADEMLNSIKMAIYEYVTNEAYDAFYEK